MYQLLGGVEAVHFHELLVKIIGLLSMELEATNPALP